MLPQIEESTKNLYLSAFNNKIELYNTLSRKIETPIESLLDLLNEINYMHSVIKGLYIDSQSTSTYESIVDFPGIGQ